ncbi:hypothetical protein D3C80_2119380 [compost metagenome]
MGRATQALAEHAGEVIFAQARLPGEFAQGDGLGQVGQQILLHPPDHRRGQAAPHLGEPRRLPGMVAIGV